jgi:hypothetical protein
LIFVGVVDVYFILVEDCNVVCINELGDAEERVVLNTWYDVHVLCGMAHVMLEFIHVVCLLHLAVGHAEGLVRLLSCCDKCFLALSLVVPTFDVAPLSAMAEGMDPSRTPSLISLLLFTCWLLLLFCLLTGQLGGAVLSNIE